MRIVVPVKPLAQAKSRLGTMLSAADRAMVVRGLLERVLASARAIAPVSVVTADALVRAWARAAGADVIDEAEVLGLNAAARLGVDHARLAGETRVMVLAADLPDVSAQALAAMAHQARPDALVIAPSRDGGTNALIVGPRADFQFAYGPDSFARHRREAERLGMIVVRHDSRALSVDIDWPRDLADHRDLWAA
jgi:2-phospho-L-lactate guanylyltransferase